MKLHKAFLLIFLFLLCKVAISVGQSSSGKQPLVAMQIITTPVNDTLLNGLYTITDSTIFSATMVLDLSDTTAIQSFIVTLGTTSNSTEFLHQEFLYDVYTLQQPFSYSRIGYSVQLGLGTFENLISYQSSVRIRRTDGTISEEDQFTR